MVNLSNKSSLRQHFKWLRQQLPQSRLSEAKQALTTTLYPILEPFERILSFASFNDEIDLWQLNEQLAQNRQLYLPKMDKGNIVPCLVTNIHSQLTRSQHGVLEPDPLACPEIDKTNLDCILVPGLCFDENRYRLGYGLGHFDRFLKDLLAVSTFGVGYKEQFIPKLPTENHDVALTKVYLF